MARSPSRFCSLLTAAAAPSVSVSAPASALASRPAQASAPAVAPTSPWFAPAGIVAGGHDARPPDAARERPAFPPPAVPRTPDGGVPRPARARPDTTGPAV